MCIHLYDKLYFIWLDARFDVNKLQVSSHSVSRITPPLFFSRCVIIPRVTRDNSTAGGKLFQT